MSKNIPGLIICLIFFTTFLVLFLFSKCLISLRVFQDFEPEYSWLSHCVTNVLGYSTVIIPGYLVFKYIRKTNYLDRAGNGFLPTIIHKFFGEEELIDRANSSSTPTQYSQSKKAVLLVTYFIGLLISFLCWGVLQEKIMTQNYVNSLNETSQFKDSQFLVLVNRVLAFCFSGIYICCKRQPRHKCPLYKYIFCSLSNVMSSWCQYEALKYVSFLHQVLSKAAKTIPVMIMGKIISRTKYEYYEYLTAIILSVGMLFFMLDTGDDNGTTITTFTGVVLLTSYIAFDSFTSNWQGALFKSFGMSPVQMMCAVNFFSCILTSTSLLQKGGFIESINFMYQFPSFIIDCFLLSFCSAIGQLLIFSTLATFGPLVFAIISTIRQGCSVLLSCLIYHHQVNALGIFGIVLVFFSIFLRIYCSYRMKNIRNRRPNEGKN
ncbi:adenosine 3'-phospho 5'-phosphosulfate transporter 1 [Onthophagus taurus]|uniref:adenosine 3'-phospho 5'-phosphosulfate transporter 1 n=1 Tax=Onthophagus taurus TaxID=166361 RepID=UPI000C1FF8F2|nr:adenosine 3'-phospho 5'-phosphosulfate transporter 1 [Onthophagus taurus]